MSISPGTYIIHRIDGTNLVMDHHADTLELVCWSVDHTINQTWYLKPDHRDLGYVLQSVWKKTYFQADGSKLRDTCSHNATVWHLDKIYDDVYTISVAGTRIQMWVPCPASEGDQVRLVERDGSNDKAHLWKLEKISDDVGEVLSPPQQPTQILNQPASRVDSTQYTFHPQVDDAHWHTDMLFNMPRAPFSAVQRAAALDWARKLGTINVPTAESFSECERILGAPPNNNNTV